MNRIVLGSVVAATLAGLCGCSSDKEKPRDPTMHNMAVLCYAYTHCFAEKRHPPRDEAELTESVRELYPDTDPDQLFVSPRDGQPYEIFYGCPVRDEGMRTVL